MVAIKNVAIFVGAVAAAIVKRDINTVLTDLQTVGTNTDALTSALQGYSGISSSPPILAASSTLQKSIDQATSDANAVSSASDSDQQNIIAAVEKLIPGIFNSLSVFESKYNQFQSDGLLTVATNNLAQLQSSTDALSKVLVGKASGANAGPASQLAAEIDAGFNAAKSNGPLPATTPIAVGGGSSPATTGGSAPASTGAASAPATTAASSKPTGTAASTPTSTLSVYTGAAIANGVNFGAAAAAFAALFL